MIKRTNLNSRCFVRSGHLSCVCLSNRTIDFLLIVVCLGVEK